MPSAQRLRHQIEAALSNRIPAALSPMLRAAPSRTPCDIAAIDELLHGGLPCGAITEIVGPESSGRTTMALAFMAAITKAGSVGAWVDASDMLDPEMAAANDVDLERLLWVRCGSAPKQVLPSTNSVATRMSVASAAPQPRHTGGGSPHPRSEGRNMPEAIKALLQPQGGSDAAQLRREKKSIGTPGAPNRPITRPTTHREEQVNSDRLPPRRGDNLTLAPRCAEPQPRRVAQLPTTSRMQQERATACDSASLSIHTQGGARSNPWQALDQAIRATDLLLHGGGFSAIVLDLGSTPSEIAWRIPLATWFRFRAGCERTRTSLLLLTQHPCARSSAELVVRLQPGSMESQSRVMTGIRYCAATERNRSNEPAARVIPIRKPPQSERSGNWTSEVAWAQAR